MVFKDMSLSNVKHTIHNSTPRGKPFHMFVVLFPEVHRSEEFLRARAACSDYSMLEKTEIRWFLPGELRESRYKFRNCFITEIQGLLSFWSCYVQSEPVLMAASRQTEPREESEALAGACEPEAAGVAGRGGPPPS